MICEFQVTVNLGRHGGHTTDETHGAARNIAHVMPSQTVTFAAFARDWRHRLVIP
jgi:hypothetical protein